MTNLNDIIREHAMLVQYHTTSWTAETRDAAASLAAARAAGADPRAYKSHKNLMYGHDKRLKAVRSAQERGRIAHMKLTLPWGKENERGMRMLPVAHWQEYMEAIGGAKRAFSEALDDFVEHYHDDAMAARRLLNIPEPPPPGLYPDSAVIKSAFTLRSEFTPIPQTFEFKGLPESTVNGLQEALESEVQEKLKQAYSQATQRAITTLVEFRDRLANNQRWRKTVMDDVKAMPAMLRAFNFAGDKRLDKIALAIEKLPGGYTVEDIKEHEHVRQKLIERANLIVSKLGHTE